MDSELVVKPLGEVTLEDLIEMKRVLDEQAVPAADMIWTPYGMFYRNKETGRYEDEDGNYIVFEDEEDG